MNDSPDVGSRIRELRKERKLSLRAVAEMCDVSPNTVSLIERGITSPSVSTLQRLATGFRLPIADFFVSKSPPTRLVVSRSGNRLQSSVPDMTIEYLGAGLAHYALASFLITMEPGADANAKPIEHVGVEWVYCLAGTVEYEIDGRDYRLLPGDNLLFEASLSHRWRNPGPGKSQMLLTLDSGERHDVTVEQHL